MNERLINLLDRFKLPVSLSLIGIVLIIGGLFINTKPQAENFPKESIVESAKIVRVDVSGSVNKPGVYQLKEGSRIEDAIALAGGFTENAQSEYIAKTLNLAQKLVDGSKIYIPAKGEVADKAVAGVSAKAGAGKINVNLASLVELDTLPGIGAVTAKKIVDGRPYQSVDELLSKKIVSASVFAKIKDMVVVY